ncbi:MAG: hypothetical protein ACKVQA_08555 [Burkholderiales bacterium]
MVADLRLGFFEDFKGADTVLLSGSVLGIRNLVGRIRAFAASSEQELPIHEFAAVSAHQPAKLFVVRTPRTSGGAGNASFAWVCPPLEIEDVLGMLSAIAERGLGHHYFDLLASEVQLIVSVGEYDDPWWSRRDG